MTLQIMNSFLSQGSLEDKIGDSGISYTPNPHPSSTIEVSKINLLHSIAYAMNNKHFEYGSKLLRTCNDLFDKDSRYTSQGTLDGEAKVIYEKLLSLKEDKPPAKTES